MIPMLFIFLTVLTVFELSLPIVDMIRQQAARRPWKKIYDVLTNPPKPGKAVTVTAPDYRFGQYTVPCNFTVERDAERPVILHYRLDVGDMESFSFTDMDANGSIVRYLMDEVYRGKWIA